ncbi:PucR family transcriptional regulator ligand-binding domain-containing protein [Brevibacillus humidisoli]|uniref:PucR family transcriptional regulator n=1 Tax=Brevibacillus humidisoli TaxID=2895522 RepID=UPI001E576C31|nr:PucR family transcriptional regulator [Brevibacillus humidisoli]UFJ39807.1 PucR family transcriptional regulator ligand-binding domain-containing protein [Brevibacillus humidisoli]
MDKAGVTVRELMRIPLLKEAKVISGAAGLDRIVRNIDIMEVPEVEGWLREGELLLTTAYSIRHDPSRLPELVQHLAEAGAAALAIKPERFLHDLPEEMILMSERYSLPIIEIPTGIPYIDITHAVMEQVLDRQAYLLRRSEEVHKTLTNMVLENSGLQAVADLVADLVKAPVRVVDIYGQVLVSSPQQMEGRGNRLLSWDITVDKQVVGKLQVDKERLDEMEQVCVEQARLVVALELMRRKTAEDTESRLRGNFVDELLSHLPPQRHEVERRGRQLGLHPEYRWIVAVVENDQAVTTEPPSFWASLQQLLEQEAQRRSIRLHAETRGNRALLLLPIQETNGRQEGSWRAALEAWVGHRSGMGALRIGVGREYPLWNVHYSYTEARKALSIGTKLGSEAGVTAYAEVELFQLLAEFADHPGFADLFTKKLGKLYSYDKENGSDLLKTLFFYLESGGSLIETANRLYIHRNSVKYRLERMKEIAGLDLNDPRERFICQVCLTCHYVKGEENV